MAPARLRATIVELSACGELQSEIAKRLKISRQSVSRTLGRFHELGNLEDRPRSGRPATVNSSRTRNILRNKIRRNPKRSMRKMAKELGVSEWSIRNIVKHHLHLKPYKLQRVHLLNPSMMDTRVQRSKHLLIRFAGGKHRLILFTDEKVFTLEEKFNKQNVRILSPNVSAAQRLVGTSSHPASVMVWAGITASGKTPLVFVDKGVKINQENYREEILKAVVEPWAQAHFGQEQWTFQQDSAPAHRAKMTQDWCKGHFPNVITSAEWPPYSPDLNPLDYSVWSVLEAKACAKPHNSLEELKRSLQAAWDELDVEMLRAIVDNFPKRLRACIRAKGGHFESV